jgi:hypothetical protein
VFSLTLFSDGLKIGHQTAPFMETAFGFVGRKKFIFTSRYSRTMNP